MLTQYTVGLGIRKDLPYDTHPDTWVTIWLYKDTLWYDAFCDFAREGMICSKGPQGGTEPRAAADTISVHGAPTLLTQGALSKNNFIQNFLYNLFERYWQIINTVI